MTQVITFRTGKVIEPNRGFIGINSDFEISEGYDSEYHYYEDFIDTYDSRYEGVLTRDERIELCDHMISRWQEFKNTQVNSGGLC